MGALVLQHGIYYLFAAVVLMGILQIVFALLRLGKFIRMVRHPVTGLCERSRDPDLPRTIWALQGQRCTRRGPPTGFWTRVYTLKGE